MKANIDKINVSSINLQESINDSNDFRPYSLSSIQRTKDNKNYLLSKAVLGFDDINKKSILDNILFNIDFLNVKKIY